MKKISFQLINGDKHTLEVDEELTILDVKEKIHNLMKEGSKIEPKDQRYIFMGKILADTDKISSVEGLTDSSTIFVMGKGKKPEKKEERPSQPTQPINNAPQQPQQNFYSQPPNFMPPDLQNLGQQMNNPSFVSNMIGQSIDHLQRNPAMLDMYFGQMMQGMSEADKDNFRNQILSQFKDLQRNPQQLQSAMNAMQNGGLAPPPHMSQPNIIQPCSHGYYPLGYTPPFPTYQYPSQPYMSPTPPVASNIDFAEVYKDQLVQLEEMGFPNKKLNLEALKKSNGNINLAVNFLFEWGSGNN